PHSESSTGGAYQTNPFPGDSSNPTAPSLNGVLNVPFKSAPYPVLSAPPNTARLYHKSGASPTPSPSSHQTGVRGEGYERKRGPVGESEVDTEFSAGGCPFITGAGR